MAPDCCTIERAFAQRAACLEQICALGSLRAALALFHVPLPGYTRICLLLAVFERAPDAGMVTYTGSLGIWLRQYCAWHKGSMLRYLTVSRPACKTNGVPEPWPARHLGNAQHGGLCVPATLGQRRKCGIPQAGFCAGARGLRLVSGDERRFLLANKGWRGAGGPTPGRDEADRRPPCALQAGLPACRRKDSKSHNTSTPCEDA